MSEPTPPSPLASPQPWNMVSEAYAEEVVPVFTLYARDALRIAGVQSGQEVLDVAAGPGTLSFLAAAAGAKVTALDFAPDMIAKLTARAAKESVAIDAQVGDGMALPFADARFDAAFSMFGLMFFPDRDKGLRELHRVSKPGARAAVGSWQPLDRVPQLAEVFVAMRDALPGLPFGQNKAPLGERDEVIAEMTAAGFRDVEVHVLTHSIEAPSMTEFWAFNTRTMAPLLLVQKRLGDDWARVEASVRGKLIDKFGDGPVSVSMPANLGVGTR